MKVASAPAARAALRARDGFVEAAVRDGVRARHEEEVARAAGLDGGTDAGQVLAPPDHALAGHVPAALGPLLVFQEAAGCAGIDQFAHGARDVQRIAVAGVRVHDDRNLDTAADAPRPLHDLRLRQQADVGFADAGRRHRISRDERQVEAGLRGQLGRQCVVDARKDGGVVLVEDGVYAGAHAVLRQLVASAGVSPARLPAMPAAGFSPSRRAMSG